MQIAEVAARGRAGMNRKPGVTNKPLHGVRVLDLTNVLAGDRSPATSLPTWART